MTTDILKVTLLLALFPVGLQAALIQTQTDGVVPTTYTNGGGIGFGGTLGSGSLSFDSDGTTLTVGFSPSGTIGSNIVVVYLDTRTGGFTDATMSDTGDAGRAVLSNLTRDADDAFPAGMNLGNPDFGFVFGSFGSVSFELTGGSHNFISFSPGTSVGVSLATMGLSSSQPVVDFFSALISDTNFASNESLPAGGINSVGNPGFAGPTPGYNNFNRFVVVPEPGSLLLAALGGVAMLRRRR